MNKLEYDTYLASPEWRERSEYMRRKANYRCHLCNDHTTNLNVHHRTYERVGREFDDDLVVLCRDCHERFHRKSDPTRTLQTLDALYFAINGLNDRWLADLITPAEASALSLLQSIARDLTDAINQSYADAPSPATARDAA
jgi:hypothetical protein